MNTHLYMNNEHNNHVNQHLHITPSTDHSCVADHRHASEQRMGEIDESVQCIICPYHPEHQQCLHFQSELNKSEKKNESERRMCRAEKEQIDGQTDIDHPTQYTYTYRLFMKQ